MNKKIPTIEDFKQSYLDFSKDLLKAAKIRYLESEPNFPTIERVKFFKGNYSKDLVKEPNYRDYLPIHQDSDFPKKLARSCAKIFYDKDLHAYVLSNKAGNKIKNPTFNQCEHFIYIDIYHSVLNLLINKKRFHFSKKEIINNLNDYFKIWKTGHSKIKRIVPIFHFKSDLKKISIGKQIYLRVIGDKEKSSFWNTAGVLGRHIDLEEFVECYHAFIWDYDNEGEASFRESEQLVDCAITTLRLLKKGNLRIKGIFSLPYFSGIMGPRMMFSGDILPQPSGFWLKNDYELNREELMKFKVIFKRITANSFLIYQAMKISLDRFNMCCQRSNAEDRIIDMVICLESSLLCDVSDELQHRLCMRAAQLCCRTKKPKNTYKFFKLLYEIRSKIIHNGKRFNDPKVQKMFERSPDNIKQDKFLDEIENLVRIILQELLKRLGHISKLEDVCKEIDSKIISSLNK